MYAVLRKLEERGAVARVDAEGGVRYVAGPPEDLLRRLRRQFAALLADCLADATGRGVDVTTLCL